MRATKGFTLVELLIVVVIIALVSFLTYPSMRDTLAEGRLYGSTRSVADVLTFARVQSIVRNQAHEVTITLSPEAPGGKVEVRRYAANRCENVQPTVVETAALGREVGVTALLNDQGAALPTRVICFKPNGHPANALTTVQFSGETVVELQRFEATNNDNLAPVGWPLFVRLSNMGIATLAKTKPETVANGGAQ